MKIKKIALGICLSAFVIAVNASAGVFPVSIHSSAAKNCSVASDIVPTFCTSFKSAVTNCTQVTQHMSMQAIYLGMIAMYGGSGDPLQQLTRACAATARQHGGTIQGCIGQWNCYWNGGASIDMQGQCSGNGQSCDKL